MKRALKKGKVKRFPSRGTKAKTEAYQKSVSYARMKRRIQVEGAYLGHWLHYRYFSARCNMMAEQLQEGSEVTELVDGRLKSKDYFIAEYLMTKKSAMRSHRDAFFSRKELIELGATEAEITILENDLMEGTIAKAKYDERYGKKRDAGFVKED